MFPACAPVRRTIAPGIGQIANATASRINPLGLGRQTPAERATVACGEGMRNAVDGVIGARGTPGVAQRMACRSGRAAATLDALRVSPHRDLRKVEAEGRETRQITRALVVAEVLARLRANPEFTP